MHIVELRSQAGLVLGWLLNLAVLGRLRSELSGILLLMLMLVLVLRRSGFGLLD
jgi:hypothetical protein